MDVPVISAARETGQPVLPLIEALGHAGPGRDVVPQTDRDRQAVPAVGDRRTPEPVHDRVPFPPARNQSDRTEERAAGRALAQSPETSARARECAVGELLVHDPPVAVGGRMDDRLAPQGHAALHFADQLPEHDPHLFIGIAAREDRIDQRPGPGVPGDRGDQDIRAGECAQHRPVAAAVGTGVPAHDHPRCAGRAERGEVEDPAEVREPVRVEVVVEQVQGLDQRGHPPPALREAPQDGGLDAPQLLEERHQFGARHRGPGERLERTRPDSQHLPERLVDRARARDPQRQVAPAPGQIGCHLAPGPE